MAEGNMAKKSEPRAKVKGTVNRIYIVNAILKEDGNLREGSLSPINNTLVAIEDGDIKQLSGMEKEALTKVSSADEKGNSLQIYMTDGVGCLRNFSHKLDDQGGDANSLLAKSSPVPALSATSKAYFPSKRIAIHLMLKEGSDRWIQELRNGIGELAQDTHAIDIGPQLASPKKVSVSKYFQPYQKKDGEKNEYQRWYDENKESSVQVVVIPKVNAFSVVFSDAKYKESMVEVFNSKGEPVFYGKSVSDDDSRISEADVVGDKAVAVFYDFKNEFDSGSTETHQVYRLNVTPSQPAIKSIGIDRYCIAENLHFNINTIAGDYQVVNGDPISLEESVIKQFPIMFSGLQNLKKMKVADQPDYFKSFVSMTQTTQEATSAAADVLGGDNGQLSKKAIGKLLAANMSVVDQIKYEGISVKDTLNVAFSVHDLSEKLMDVLKPDSKYHASIKEVATVVAAMGDDIAKGSAALKNSKVTEYLKNKGQIFAGDLGESWQQAATKLRLSDDQKVLSSVQMPKAVNKWLDSKQLSRIQSRINFDKVGNAAGVAGASISLASSGFGYYEAHQSSDNAKKSIESLADQYSQLLYQEVEKPEDLTKLQDFLVKIKSEYGASYSLAERIDHFNLNINFLFDESKVDTEKFSSRIKVFVDGLNSAGVEEDVLLEGHSCDRGSKEYNMALSERRALAVKDAMESAGAQFTIKAVGRGPDFPGKYKDRESRRRVEAYVKIPSYRMYFPSREGMSSLERYRSMLTVVERQKSAQAKEILKSSIDLLLCYPNPVFAAVGVFWMAGNLMMDAWGILEKLVKGASVVEFLERQKGVDVESIDNLILMLDSLDRGNVGKQDDSNKGVYIQSQYHLRAESLYGFMRLVMRCAVEEGKESVNKASVRTSRSNAGQKKRSFKEALEHYRVQDYIDNIVLKDGWKLPKGRMLPYTLEECWMQMAEEGYIDTFIEDMSKPRDVQLYTDKSGDVKVSLAAGREALVKNRELSAEKGLLEGGASAWDLLTSPFQGMSYISAKYDGYFEVHEEDVLTAQYQQFFPVHYQATKNLESFAARFSTDFISISKESIAGGVVSARDFNTTGDFNKGWSSLKDFQGKDSPEEELSPLHQIRVGVFLDPEDDGVKKAITNKSINFMPIEVTCVRDVITGDISDLPMKGFISEIPENRLTAEELKFVKGESDTSSNILLLDGKVYGAILFPAYMYGRYRLYGIRPMASETDTYLNVGDENGKGGYKLDPYWNMDGKWELDYKIQVNLAKNTAATKILEWDEGEDTFEVTLRSSRVHKYKDRKGGFEEKRLLRPHFLTSRGPQESYPPLFEGPKVVCYFRNSESGEFREFKENENGRYIFKEFDWAKPFEVVVFVVSSGIKIHEFDDVSKTMTWKSVPSTLTVVQEGVLDELASSVSSSLRQKGTEYHKALKYYGEVIEENGVHKLKRAKGIRGVSGTTNGLRTLLRDKDVLQRLNNEGGHVYACHHSFTYESLTGVLKKGLRPLDRKSTRLNSSH